MAKVSIVSDFPVLGDRLKNHLSTHRSIDVVDVAGNFEDIDLEIFSKDLDVVVLYVQSSAVEISKFIKAINDGCKMICSIVITKLAKESFSVEDCYVDFVQEPDGYMDKFSEDFLEEVVSKIDATALARLSKYRAEVPPAVLSRSTLPHLMERLVEDVSNKVVIAVGASTGGTEATVEVLKDLPKSTPGIVLVQHMPKGFTKMYAERLNKVCNMSAKEAEDGDRIEKGLIILAEAGKQMTLQKDHLGYYIASKAGDRVGGHCPSVDVLFNSVAKVAGEFAIGVILTGMGADGAEGMLAMRKAGAYTIGQDKETCVVYGMPMEAYNIGAVQVQLPLDKISAEILKAVTEKG